MSSSHSLLAQVSWVCFHTGTAIRALAGNECELEVGPISVATRATPLLPSRPSNPASTLQAWAVGQTGGRAEATEEGKVGGKAGGAACPKASPRELGNVAPIALGLS